MAERTPIRLPIEPGQARPNIVKGKTLVDALLRDAGFSQGVHPDGHFDGEASKPEPAHLIVKYHQQLARR